MMQFRVGDFTASVFAGPENGNTSNIIHHYNAGTYGKIEKLGPEELKDLQYTITKILRQLEP